MPVKVRCPTCEKVLNAPESARGKAVKCPGCDTKVKVPVGDAAGEGAAAAPTRAAGAKARAKKSADADSTDFLAKLDLDEVADSSEAMCPRCGAPLPEDASECPKCGVDPLTGQLSAGAKKRRGMKGPDPALFYKAAWGDSWAFVKENYTVALRTATYLVLFVAAAGGCAYMALQFCETLPPKIFWGALAVVCVLTLPGWVWCVTVETVRVSAARKTNIRGLHFDIFQNIALGVKSILWLVAFVLAWFMYPLSLVHMSMPVTKKGWMSFVLLPTYFKNFSAMVYVNFVHFVTMLFPAMFAGIAAGIVFGTGLYDPLKAGRFKSLTAMEWTYFSLAVISVILALGALAVTMVFNSRVIGLLAYYFQNSLDLVTFIADKEYKRKEVKVDKWGTPIKTTQQKVMEALLLVGVLALVAGSGYGIYYTLFKKS